MPGRGAGRSAAGSGPCARHDSQDPGFSLRRVKVLIFHGYLLRGTGSNIYNASLAAALARLGHEVHLLCQDRGSGDLPWVDRVGRWEDGHLRVERAGGGEGPGTVTVYIPDIGGLLPVYVE